MPRDGCRECLYRRIRCDKTEPSCQKCMKKGIECSGVGDFCFVSGPTRRRRRRTSRPNVSQAHTSSSPTSAAASLDRAEPGSSSEKEHIAGKLLAGGDSSSPVADAQSQQLSTSSTPYPCRDQSPRQTQLRYVLGADRALESLKPGISELLLNFSNTIATVMVVFDYGSNGYRDIILQLAFTDDLVQRAVCVCSAFHLGLKSPALYKLAEKGRTAIITALTHQLSRDRPENVFNTSTVATVLLLLVAETVTGSDEFSPLYKMLSALSQDSNLFSDATVTTRGFFLQQIRMFQLLTPPMLGQAPVTYDCHDDLDPYLDFLNCRQTTASGLSFWISIYKAAIGTAHKLYLMHYRPVPELKTMEFMVNSIREMTTPLQADTPGMHALVWVYFIAAASAQDPENHIYFATKLRQVYNKTRMHNIIVAVEQLERIWFRGQNEPFPRFSMMRPVLAI